MERKKIAFFCWESQYSERVGGLATAATYLAQELAKEHEVHYFTRGNHDFQYAGVHYHTVQPFGDNIIDYCSNMCHEFVKIFRELDMPKFDLLHFHDWHVVEALHLLQDRNTMFTYHSTEYGRNGNEHGHWWEYQEISGKEWYAGLIAKRVCAVSHILKNEIMWLYNVPDWKIDVVPNGVVPEQFDVILDQGEVKKDFGIHPFAPMVLFIGRMAYQKGPDLLIDALPSVLNEHWDVQVVMAGDGGMRPYLMDRSKDMPVQFTGYISDSEYIRLLNAADMVVIPSRNEPFGIVLPEAWSAGRGVVTTDVGGLSENVENNVNGIKVSPNVNDIAWGISEGLHNRLNLDRFGRAGRKKVDQNFRWECVTDKLKKAYRKLEN